MARGLRARVAAAALGALAAAIALSPACTDRLPSQDLRILEAPPVERLSAALLWQDYHAVREQADRNYRGRAIVVIGTATRTGTTESGEAYVYFAQTETAGIHATLLAEQASTILAAVQASPSVRLKCFCEGLSTNVVLKSCVTEQ